MKKAEIAKKYGVSDSYISHLATGRRKTLNFELARDVASATGEPAENYIATKMIPVFRKLQK